MKKLALIGVICLPLAGQPANITILPPQPAPLGFLTAPFRQRIIPPVNLADSSRLGKLIRAGNLYLTAADVVALVLENNLDIEVQRYSPLMAREDIRRAQSGGALRNPTTPLTPGPQSVSTAGINVSATSLATGTGVGSSGGVTGAYGSQIPQTEPFFSIGASTGHYTTPESNIIVDETNYLVVNTRSLSMSYNQQFWPGTSVSLSYYSTRADYNSPTTILNPVTQGGLSLNISQNLLQGFGTAVNQRYVLTARNNAHYAELQLKQQVMTTVSAALNLYWDLVAFNEDVRLKGLALDAARKLYQDNQRELDAGAVASIELVRAQAEIPARRQDVLIAQTNLLQQETVLKNVLSRKGIEDPVLADVHIVPLDPIQTPDDQPLPPLKQLLDQALAERPDLEQNRINMRSQALLLKGDKSELRPALQAFVSLTNNAQAGANNPLNVDYAYGAPDPFYLGGYGTLLAQILRRNFPNYSAGVSLSIPIRNRAAQADFATDMLGLRQQQLQFERAVNQVGVDVRNAVIGLQQALTRYQAAIEARKLAEETLAAEQKKYEYGKSTNALVIQAQRDVVTSESEQVQSMANYTHARIAFEQALGLTLDRNHITMAEAGSGKVERPSILPDTLPKPAEVKP